MAKHTISITHQIELDLDFPLYVKVNDYTFCLYMDENKGIKVETYDFSYGIDCSTNMPKVWLTCEQISKEEFESEFKKVQEKINQLI